MNDVEGQEKHCKTSSRSDDSKSEGQTYRIGNEANLFCNERYQYLNIAYHQDTKNVDKHRTYLYVHSSNIFDIASHGQGRCGTETDRAANG